MLLDLMKSMTRENDVFDPKSNGNSGTHTCLPTHLYTDYITHTFTPSPQLSNTKPPKGKSKTTEFNFDGDMWHACVCVLLKSNYSYISSN